MARKTRATGQAELAERFRRLHDRKETFVLPNCWDVPSARMFEDCGFPAVATSSAGVMVSLGYPDGQEIPLGVYLSTIERIGGVLSVPLSVDMVAGFGADAAKTARAVKKAVQAGAVGVNIEDFEHASKKMIPLKEQVRKLKAVIEMRDGLGVPVVVNARTDALRFAEGDDDTKFAEAVRRGKEFRDLGADCVYPMGLVDVDKIGRYVEEVDCPVNVMVRKGLPDLGELQRLGVARVSFGPSASYAAMGLLKRASKEIMDKGTFGSLVDGAINFDELNALATRRR
jgi:2-methylisocitrate lyase-like PEP mutase family enzyme